jgi:hypothetical protein
VAVALMLVAAFRFARLPPAGRAALMLVLVAAIAVVLHPQHQPRFLASWIFAVWIAAGAGAGILFEGIAGKRLRAAAIAIASKAALALIAGTARQSLSPRVAFYASRTPVSANDLDLVRPYLAELDGAHGVLFATTFGMSKLFHWMLREHCRCRIAVEEPWIEGVHSRAEARDLMAQRVAHSSADAVVIIDAPQSPNSHPPFGWVYGSMAGIPDAMTGQNNYIASGTYLLPGQGGQATLWRRAKKPAPAGE